MALLTAVAIYRMLLCGVTNGAGLCTVLWLTYDGARIEGCLPLCLGHLLLRFNGKLGGAQVASPVLYLWMRPGLPYFYWKFDWQWRVRIPAPLSLFAWSLPAKYESDTSAGKIICLCAGRKMRLTCGGVVVPCFIASVLIRQNVQILTYLVLSYLSFPCPA
jgi:hypothetical protein